MYRWQTEEYSKRVDEFHQKPEEYMECYKNHATPTEIKNHVPRIGVLSEKGMRILGNMTGWFDTEAICEIARDGIDLGCTLPDGARPPEEVPLWKGGVAEEEYMMESVVKRGIIAGHLREARKGEEKRAILHPVFLQLKKMGPPNKYRDIINFKKRLSLSKWGSKDISFNESTPLELRPSVSPGSIKDAIRMLEYATKVRGIPRESMRGAKLDLAEAYKHVRIKKGLEHQQGFKIKGKIYLSLRMQFGTAASASIWCRVMNAVDAAFKKMGLGTVSYFDDILLICCSPELSETAMETVRDILVCAGMKLNEQKSDKIGKRVIEFVGMKILRAGP